MHIALWILQVLLAAQFLWHGWLMVAPPAELVEIMSAQFAPWFRIFVCAPRLCGLHALEDQTLATTNWGV